MIDCGQVRIGAVTMSIIIDPETNGFLFRTGDSCEIVLGILGIEHDEDDILSGLSHEVHELMFHLHGLRYAKTDSLSNDNGHYYFAMTHTEFSEANAKATSFYEVARKLVKEELKKINRKKRK